MARTTLKNRKMEGDAWHYMLKAVNACLGGVCILYGVRISSLIMRTNLTQFLNKEEETFKK